MVTERMYLDGMITGNERPRARDFLRGPNGVNGLQMLVSCLLSAMAEADEKERPVMIYQADIREGMPSFVCVPLATGRGGRFKKPRHPAILVYPDGHIELHGDSGFAVSEETGAS